MREKGVEEWGSEGGLWGRTYLEHIWRVVPGGDQNEGKEISRELRTH